MRIIVAALLALFISGCELHVCVSSKPAGDESKESICKKKD